MNKELSCGQVATACQSMIAVGEASRELDQVLGNLQHARVHVDVESFKHVQYYLDQIHAQLAPLPLANVRV